MLLKSGGRRTYYVVALASLSVILVLPAAGDFHPGWKANFEPATFVSNILIFPFEFYDPSLRLVPPIWSVGVELINYFVLWIVVARNRKMAIASVLLTASYHVFSLLTGQQWPSRYFPSYAALLPFSLGACVYFYRDFLSRRLSPNALVIGSLFSFVAWLLNVVICSFVSGLGEPLFSYFFYVNLACLLTLVACLSAHPLNSLFRNSGKTVGDLAYPIFLTHWIIGFMMSELFLGGQERGLLLLAVSVLPILVVSFALSKLTDRWVEPMRAMVRARAAI